MICRVAARSVCVESRGTNIDGGGFSGEGIGGGSRRSAGVSSSAGAAGVVGSGLEGGMVGADGGELVLDRQRLCLRDRLHRRRLAALCGVRLARGQPRGGGESAEALKPKIARSPSQHVTEGDVPDGYHPNFEAALRGGTYGASRLIGNGRLLNSIGNFRRDRTR